MKAGIASLLTLRGYSIEERVRASHGAVTATSY